MLHSLLLVEGNEEDEESEMRMILKRMIRRLRRTRIRMRMRLIVFGRRSGSLHGDAVYAVVVIGLYG